MGLENIITFVSTVGIGIIIWDDGGIINSGKNM
jgi:hypothetical protein